MLANSHSFHIFRSVLKFHLLSFKALFGGKISYRVQYRLSLVWLVILVFDGKIRVNRKKTRFFSFGKM